MQVQDRSSKGNLNSVPDSAWNRIRISIIWKLLRIPNTGVLSIIPLLWIDCISWKICQDQFRLSNFIEVSNSIHITYIALSLLETVCI